MGEYTHFDADGRPTLVDVSGKSVTKRTAWAEGWLYLPDEMFRQGGSRFRIVAGDPIAPDGLRGTLRQQADTVRGEVYRLKEKLPCTK